MSPETGLASSPRATTKTSACCGNSQEPNPPVIPTPELGPSAQGALWEFLPSYLQSRFACLNRSPAVAASSERVVVPRNPAIDNTSLGPPTPPPPFCVPSKATRRLPATARSRIPPTYPRSKKKTGGVCPKHDCQSQLVLVACELFREWKDLAVTERFLSTTEAGGILRGQLQLQLPFALDFFPAGKRTETLRGAELYSTSLQFNIYAPYSFSFVARPYDPAFESRS